MNGFFVESENMLPECAVTCRAFRVFAGFGLKST